MYAKVEDQPRQEERIFGSPIVVWLDSKFEDDLSYQAISISALQQTGQSVKTFANLSAFVDFITNMEDEKVIAIISDEFCQSLLSSVYDLPRVI
jgi:hypothetical protein